MPVESSSASQYRKPARYLSAAPSSSPMASSIEPAPNIALARTVDGASSVTLMLRSSQPRPSFT